MKINTPSQDKYQHRSGLFRLQSTVAKLLPDARVAKCLRKFSQFPNKKRQLKDSFAKIYKSDQHQHTFLAGLEVCGSIWVCPVCAAKVSERRKEELERITTEHRRQGGELVMITRTVPHEYAHDLKTFLTTFLEAESILKKDRQYKKIVEKVGLIGTVRVLEVTYGTNGWHVHTHELWFIEKAHPALYGRISGLCYDPDIDKYIGYSKQGLFNLWTQATKKAGFNLSPSPYAFGIHNGDYVSAYLAKWGKQTDWTASAELTKSHIKTNQYAQDKGQTPFDLIRNYQQGDKQAGEKFKEFAQVFKGRHQLQYSHGLKKRFALPEKTDLQLAQETTARAEFVGGLNYHDWLLILKHDLRAKLLDLASHNWQAVANYLFNLRRYNYV
ncbi:Replication protein [Beggiatoa alba B18LD]|uniref:Replication protein n=1 Tax=Beggiatoa alba B18LD TaxID=395493 RepID=I3CFG3_9GAMM|nr:protein rep [Beggiatoa alba]EIJ42356.1 Replication protein [Beggiatoa alba B18LD]